MMGIVQILTKASDWLLKYYTTNSRNVYVMFCHTCLNEKQGKYIFSETFSKFQISTTYIQSPWTMIKVICLKNQFCELLAAVPAPHLLVAEHNIPGVELVKVPKGIFGRIRWRNIIIRAENQSVNICKKE